MPAAPASKERWRRGPGCSGCGRPAIAVWPRPSQHSAPVSPSAPQLDTVGVTDPTHPLYGLTFPLIGVTIKQRLGRVCRVWLSPGIERDIPVAATSLAGIAAVPPAGRLCVAGVQALVAVVASVVAPRQEAADAPAAAGPAPATL